MRHLLPENNVVPGARFVGGEMTQRQIYHIYIRQKLPLNRSLYNYTYQAGAIFNGRTG